MTTEIERDLEGQIRMAHDRFVHAMNARLPAMPLEQKERYFAVFSALLAKLETRDKALRQVLQEMVAEVGAQIFQELGAPR